jgi:hypothetical protein
MRYFLSAISNPYSNSLVAVVVLQAIIQAHMTLPVKLFKSMKIEMAAKKQKGSKLYPKLLAQVNKSTY